MHVLIAAPDALFFPVQKRNCLQILTKLQGSGKDEKLDISLNSMLKKQIFLLYFTYVQKNTFIVICMIPFSFLNMI